jgi:hypothetical protein
MKEEKKKEKKEGGGNGKSMELYDTITMSFKLI